MGPRSVNLLGLMDKEKNWLDWFYYAAPVWLALETFFLPNFRAGAITGGSMWGNLAFYGAEWGLGAALYARLRWARPAALIENIALLVLLIKFVVLSPLDMASNIEDAAVADMGASYAAALPGALYSCLHVVLRIKSELKKLKLSL